MLFGSRARGDANEDSDYDVAVFLRDMPDRRTEWERLARLRLKFLDAGGPFFEAIPFRASDYDARTPLMHEIRREAGPVKPKRRNSSPTRSNCSAMPIRCSIPVWTITALEPLTSLVSIWPGHIPLNETAVPPKPTAACKRSFSDCRRMTTDQTRASRLLTTAYHYKSSSDYETGPEDNPSPEEAREAVETARRFVAQFALSNPPPCC